MPQAALAKSVWIAWWETECWAPPGARFRWWWWERLGTCSNKLPGDAEPPTPSPWWSPQERSCLQLSSESPPWKAGLGHASERSQYDKGGSDKYKLCKSNVNKNSAAINLFHFSCLEKNLPLNDPSMNLIGFKKLHEYQVFIIKSPCCVTGSPTNFYLPCSEQIYFLHSIPHTFFKEYKASNLTFMQAEFTNSCFWNSFTHKHQLRLI